MSDTRWTRRTLLAAAGIASAGLPSCGGALKVSAGSKDVAESMILAEIGAMLLERKLKAKITRRLGLGNSQALFQAVQNADVHFYPEYSHMGYRVYFKAEEPIDAVMSTEKLRGLFRSNSMTEWLDPLGFESNHSVVVRADDENFSGKTTLSAVSEDKTGWKLGFTSDFAQSPEGYTLLKTSYQIAERVAPRIEPTGQLYFGLNEKRIDMLITTSTDPLAKDAKYRTLEDDKGTFKDNRCAFLLHGATVEDKPEFVQTLRLLSGRINNETMLRLNGEVLLKKRPVADVAAEWLTGAGFGA
jgi:glycine betaine/choline ABC-type transport system substrate-binding protein